MSTRQRRARRLDRERGEWLRGTLTLLLARKYNFLHLVGTMRIGKTLPIVASALTLFALCFSTPGSGAEADSNGPTCSLLVKQATSARVAGDFERALALLREAQGLSRGLSRSREQASCLMNLGITLWDLGEIQKSARCFSEAAALFREQRETLSEDLCRKGVEIIRLYNLGKECRSGNQNRKSLDCFEKAIGLGRSTGIQDFELKCLRQKSLTYMQIGDIEMFLTCNKRGLEIAKEICHRKEVGRCLNNIGVYYEKVSDYSNALRSFTIALPILRSENELDTEAKCLNNIGTVYKNMGEFDRALRAIYRVLEIDEKSGDHLSALEDRANLGAIYLRRGWLKEDVRDLQRALKELSVCLDKLRLNPNPRLEFAVVTNLGFAYYLLHEYDHALSLYANAQKLSETNKLSDEHCHLLNNIAHAYYGKGNLERAIQYYLSSVSLCKGAHYQELLWEAYFGLGRCYEAQNDILKSLTYYRKSIEAIEKIRGQISLDMFKISFVRDKLTVYQRALDILYSLYSASPSLSLLEEIFQMIERAKARAFLEGLVTADKRSKDIPDPEVGSLEKRLSHEISNLNMKVGAGDLAAAERTSRLRELEIKEEEYLRLMSDAKTETRARYKYAPLFTVCLSDVQTNLLDRGTALLEYFVGVNRSYLLLITLHDARLYALPGKSELEKSLRGYLKSLSSPPVGPFGGMLAAERIARELVFPLQNDVPSAIDTLIIIPDGILHLLPFEALRVNDGRGPIYLVEKYKMSYCSSSAALSYLKQKPRPPKRAKKLLAFGAPLYHQPAMTAETREGTPAGTWRESYIDKAFALSRLPFSESEVLKVARLFPADLKDVFLGKEANETALKKLALKEYQIIHFACHGILDDTLPFRSALALSYDESQEEDGFLQVREIYNLDINAELVVLSACQTGNGTLEKGEGLVGLTRGFFHAGARSILSSIWSINDRSTASFMEEFYSNLARGQDKSGALRMAKLSMLRSPHAHPFNWAGFILNGDPAPILIEGNKAKRLN